MLEKFHSAEEKHGRIKPMTLAFHRMTLTLHRKTVSSSARVTSHPHWASRKVKAEGRQPISAEEGELQPRPHHWSRRRTWAEQAARPAWPERRHVRTTRQTRGVAQPVRAQGLVSASRGSPALVLSGHPSIQPISDPRDPRAHSEKGELDFT